MLRQAADKDLTWRTRWQAGSQYRIGKTGVFWLNSSFYIFAKIFYICVFRRKSKVYFFKAEVICAFLGC